MALRYPLNRGPRLVDPSTLVAPAPPAGPMGPTRLCEWLMVDIRVANLVSNERERYARLFKICQELSERQPPACGVVAGTIIIDLPAVEKSDRQFLLDATNWPKPGGPDDGGTDRP